MSKVDKFFCNLFGHQLFDIKWKKNPEGKLIAFVECDRCKKKFEFKETEK